MFAPSGGHRDDRRARDAARRTGLRRKPAGVASAATALALAACLAACACAAPARAQEASNQTRITAALVYNFCKFVAWPPTAGELLLLGVAGGPEHLAGFADLQGKPVGSQTIAVVASPDTTSMAGLGLVYLPPDGPIEEALSCLRGRPVLTVSDREGFCAQGGMIELQTVRGKMRFAVNPEAARLAGLEVSSQLLKMAQTVVGGGQ